MKAFPEKSLDELVESGVVQLTRGKVISKRDIAACPGNYPIYSSAKDNDGKFGEYGQFLFDEELITWSVDGGGRLFHRPKHKFSVTNVGGILRIRDRSVLDYRYLYYVLSLRHSEISFDWVRKAHPSVIKKLYQNIPVPPLPEQRRIVGILDEAFEGIATAKANAGKNRENARALFESHLQSVFTQRGPGWVEKPLGEMCERITKGSSPKWQGIAYVDKPGILFVTSENVGEYQILLAEPKYVEEAFNTKDKKSILKKGDVLTNIVGASIGRTAVFDRDDVTNINQAVCLIRCEPDVLDNFFLTYLLNSPIFKQVLHDNEVDNARANLSLGFFSQLLVPTPHLPEQRTIVADLDTLREETKRLEFIYQRKLAALDALKKSLLHQAFTGKL
jgi:type I restriction enzyme S subunit